MSETFLLNCWQVAAFATEVGRTLMTRRLCDRAVLFYRTQADEVVGMADRCPHRNVPLSLGTLDGDVVQCGYHGLRFAPSGTCVRIPGQPIVPSRVGVTVYPTVEKHGFIWIWLGDADKADVALVPDAHWMTDSEWAVAEGYHHIAANYRFLVDNLLDLSHETFVHPETIGNGAVADSPVAVSVLPDGRVRAHRDMRDCEPPPQFVAMVGFTGQIDRWHTTFYAPPAYCMIEIGARSLDPQQPDVRFEGRIINLITPETQRSSHYFWGHARDIRRNDIALTDAIRGAIKATFDQDKVVLEAQQIEAEAVGSYDPGLVLGIDAGPVRGRRVLAAALQAEA